MSNIIDAVRFRFLQNKVGSVGKTISRKEKQGLSTKKDQEEYNKYKAEYDAARLQLDKQVKKKFKN